MIQLQIPDTNYIGEKNNSLNSFKINAFDSVIQHVMHFYDKMLFLSTYLIYVSQTIVHKNITR